MDAESKREGYAKRGIFLCDREQMWTGQPGRVMHAETEEVGEQEGGWPGGDIVTIRCKVCGETWREELPQ